MKKQRELLGTAYDETDHVNRLVHHLLSLAPAESNGMQLHKEWLSLQKIVGAALSRLEHRLRGREVTVDIPAGLPMLYVDERLIGQVLISLLENADRCTPPEASITIRARAALPSIAVEVYDDGPGFAPDELQRVFEKFHRGEAFSGSGPGVGLTVCAAIVQQHGGEIEVGNCPEGGASIRFTLPLTDQPEVGSAREPVQEV